jgi:cysteine desulfurase
MPNLSDYLLPDGRYYFDNAATTKMSKEALRVYNETAEKWFMNPMSYKDFDPEIERLLEGAREHVAEFVGGNPNKDRVIFTSGATESINLLLKGYFFENFQQKRKIITSQIEHKAVLETCKYLETIGAEIEYVNITSEGVVDYDHLETIVDRETLFVCLMHVNNETGEVSDLERIYDITQAANTKFFTDTTQSITKLEVNAKYFDACVGSAHKFNGPKGVGFLFLKNESNKLLSIVHGGDQEYRLRAGTHNLPSILSMISEVKLKATDYDYFRNYVLIRLRNDFNATSIGINVLGSIMAVELKGVKIDTDFISQIKWSVFSSGSACNGGVFGSSVVYKKLSINPIIRFSF